MNVQERYNAILNAVRDVFSADGVILTGSAVDVISGETQEFQSRRFGFYTDGKKSAYLIQPSHKDLDLLVATDVAPEKMPSYLSEQAKKLQQNLSQEDRSLLDLDVCDSYLLKALGRLRELAEYYESAQLKGTRALVSDARISRISVVNTDLMRTGNLYYEPDGTFINCCNLPLGNAPYNHTTSLASGRRRLWVNNQKACEKVLQASQLAYVLEDLAEKRMEADAQRKLKTSGVEIIHPIIMDIFMILAREHGFRKSEEKQNRRVKGMWDPNLADDFAQQAMDYLQRENNALYSILKSMD